MRKDRNSFIDIIRTTDGVVWFVVAFAFYMASHFTLLVGDDIYYKFICGSTSSGYPERITGFADLWTSFWGHFKVMNGRSFLNVFLLQSFLNLVPVWLFDLMNTGVWLGLTYIIAKQVDVKDNKSMAKVLFITSVLLFALCPAPYETLFWKAGAVNYLWSSLALMLALYVYVKEKPPVVVTLLLCLWLGLMHEGFCVPFIVFVVIDAMMRKSMKRLLFAGVTFGGFSLQFFNSTGSRDQHSIFSLFTDFALWRVFDLMESLTSSIAFLVVAISMVVWLSRDWKSAVAYIKGKYYYFALLFLYMGMMIVVGHISGPRKFMPVHIISIFILVDLYITHCKYKISSWVFFGIFLGCAVWYGTSDLIPKYQKTKEEIEIIQSSNDEHVMAAVSPVRLFAADDFGVFYTNYSLYYRTKFQKVYDLSNKQLPIIRFALPEEIYKGIYLSDTYCSKSNEIEPGVFLFRDEHIKYDKRQYVIIRCDDGLPVFKGHIDIHFIHENYPFLNGLMDKIRKPKTVRIDSSDIAALNSVYGVQYLIINVGWPKFYKVAGIGV